MPTPYRSEIDALRERKTSLEGDLARLRAETRGLDELRARQAQLAKELADVDGRLNAGQASRRGLPLLDQVKIATPCQADWNAMVGNERVRFCLSCEKNVFNLSAMPRDEAESLLQSHLNGDVCVRFYQRADGTVMTQDCPVGVKKKQRKRLALAVAGAGALVAASAAALLDRQTRTGVVAPAVAGGMMYEAPPAIPDAVPEAVPDPIPVVMGAAPAFVPPTPPPTSPPAVMGRAPSTRGKGTK